MISVRKYLVLVLLNSNPVSRHLQCGITLYSKYKNETRIRNLNKWCGIYVVLLLLLFLLLLLLLVLVLLLLLLNQIKLVINDLFLLFSLSVCSLARVRTTFCD